jgi:hypothetical protein
VQEADRVEPRSASMAGEWGIGDRKGSEKSGSVAMGAKGSQIPDSSGDYTNVIIVETAYESVLKW